MKRVHYDTRDRVMHGEMRRRDCEYVYPTFPVILYDLKHFMTKICSVINRSTVYFIFFCTKNNMGGGEKQIKSVAIIGAGAAGKPHYFPRTYIRKELTITKGAVTAAAFKAENYYDRIRVFERRETPGGTW